VSRIAISDWLFLFALVAGTTVAVACLMTGDTPRPGDRCCFERLDLVCWKYGRLLRSEDGTGLFCALVSEEDQ
jgi:hypothetical protein